MPTSLHRDAQNIRRNWEWRTTAESPATPSKTLAQIAAKTAAGGEVLCAIAQNPNTSPETLAALAERRTIGAGEAGLSFLNHYLNVAKNPRTPQHALAKLATEKDDNIVQLVALNPSTSQETLAKMLETPQGVNGYAARNPGVPISLLEKLAAHADADVRCHVACNRITPPEILEKLAADSDRRVRTEVVANPNTTLKILENLTTDENNYIRATVARHRNTSVKILEKLFGDTNYDVREAVAENTKTPPALLAKSAEKDGMNNVVKSASLNPQTPEESRQIAFARLKLLDEEVNKNILDRHVKEASNTSTYSYRLKELSSSKYIEVRVAVAANPNIPPETYQRLSQQDDYRIKNALGGNTKGTQAFSQYVIAELSRMLQEAKQAKEAEQVKSASAGSVGSSYTPSRSTYTPTPSRTYTSPNNGNNYIHDQQINQTRWNAIQQHNRR